MGERVSANCNEIEQVYSDTRIVRFHLGRWIKPRASASRPIKTGLLSLLSYLRGAIRRYSARQAARRTRAKAISDWREQILLFGQRLSQWRSRPPTRRPFLDPLPQVEERTYGSAKCADHCARDGPGPTDVIIDTFSFGIISEGDVERSHGHVMACPTRRIFREGDVHRWK